MQRLIFVLRAGNFLRILLGCYVLASAMVIVIRPSTIITVSSFVLATAVALVTSLVVGARIAVVLKGWERAAARAANEDFNAVMMRNVPSAWLPLRDALEQSRDRLADSLQNAREEKALLVSMLNAMTEGVIAVDANAHILLVNRVALSVLGVTAMQAPEDFAGEHLVRVVRDPRLNELIDRVLATGRPMADETEIHATRKVCSVSVAPVIENGQVHGVVAAISDKTALTQLERVRQDFVTNVSHELKTPLAAIRGWAETLHSGMFDVPDDLQEPIETIFRQSKRLSALVDDLMTLSRVETSPAEEPDIMVDIGEVITEACDVYRGSIDEKSIDVDIDVDDRATKIPVDRRSLRYILNNLIDNAVKYSPSNTTIHVRVSRDETSDGYRIDVTDEGRGIERHHLARIFERFYRVDSGRGRDVGGTGLGLSIVKNIATRYGGRVRVDSEVGEGSTFTVIFPSDGADDGMEERTDV